MGGLFWELHQNRRIADAEVGVSRTAADAANTTEKLRRLEKRVDSLVLLNRAMWSILEEKTGMTEADLMDHLEVQMEIVASTQRATDRACTQCGRTLKPRQERCLYCGTPRTYDSIFDQF